MLVPGSILAFPAFMISPSMTTCVLWGLLGLPGVSDDFSRAGPGLGRNWLRVSVLQSYHLIAHSLALASWSGPLGPQGE